MKKIIAIFLVAIIFIMPATALAQKEDVTSVEASVVNVVMQYIEQNYRFDIDEKVMFENVVKNILKENPELYDEILKAMLSSLDEHSEYYTAEEYSDFYSYVEVEIVGIGAYLESDGEYVRIGSVIKDSPADKAGLMANDRILFADGVSLKNMGSEYAASTIRGERGTTVKLEIERNGILMNYSVVRDKVQTKTTACALLDNNIGYIQIVSFSSATATHFSEDLASLKEQGADRFIIDLRNNGGGVTDQALECAGIFLPKDTPLMLIKTKTDSQTVTNVSEGQDYPLVILINEYSASASEIFTAALKYNNMATVVGKTSFGKGTMQNTASLGVYGGLKLTVAEFCGPYGEIINGEGIVPNVVIDNVKKAVEPGYFETLKYEKKFSVGDQDEQIAVLKKMLAVLGYISTSNTDEFFDMSLYNAVKNFQKETGLFSYGVLDFSTQIAINNMANDAMYLEDTQLNKAIEIINSK